MEKEPKGPIVLPINDSGALDVTAVPRNNELLRRAADVGGWDPTYGTVHPDVLARHGMITTSEYWRRKNKARSK